MLLFGLKVRETESVVAMELGSVFAKICNMLDADGREDLFHVYHEIADVFINDRHCTDYVLSIGKDSVQFCPVETYFNSVFEDDVNPYGVFFVTLDYAGYEGRCFDTIKFTRVA